MESRDQENMGDKTLKEARISTSEKAESADEALRNSPSMNPMGDAAEHAHDVDGGEDAPVTPVAISSESSPLSVHDFAAKFYIAKQAPSEEFKKQFGSLEDGFSKDAQESLLNIAADNDKELGKTLVLAEFLLETTIRRDYRDQLMHFLQLVAGNVGTLAETPRSDHFQRWLDEYRHSPNKLERFASQIDRISQVGTTKQLPLKLRNNLISIASIWLCYREEIEIPDLIKVLRREGMNLDGEVGDNARARAFSYLASMIRSSNKKRFAYFLDWVDRTRDLVTSQLRAEQSLSQDRLRLLQNRETELERLQTNLSILEARVDNLQSELHNVEEERESLKTQLSHQDIHHGASHSFNQAVYKAMLKKIADKVDLTQQALAKGKSNVADYQLKILAEELESELK